MLQSGATTDELALMDLLNQLLSLALCQTLMHGHMSSLLSARAPIDAPHKTMASSGYKELYFISRCPPLCQCVCVEMNKRLPPPCSPPLERKKEHFPRIQNDFYSFLYTFFRKLLNLILRSKYVTHLLAMDRRPIQM